MTSLEHFNAEDQAFLIALPYRTGLWVSRCDHTGGDEAAAREISALETIITSFAEDFCKSEFVEGLMRRTVAARAQWPAWQQDGEDIPAACRRAVDMIAPVLERKDVSSFKATLLEIATTVAKAYREEEAEETAAGFSGRLRGLCDRVAARIRGHAAPAADTHISKAERAAIDALLAALQPERPEGQPPADPDSAAA